MEVFLLVMVPKMRTLFYPIRHPQSQRACTRVRLDLGVVLTRAAVHNHTKHAHKPKANNLTQDELKCERRDANTNKKMHTKNQLLRKQHTSKKCPTAHHNRQLHAANNCTPRTTDLDLDNLNNIIDIIKQYPYFNIVFSLN